MSRASLAEVLTSPTLKDPDWERERQVQEEAERESGLFEFIYGPAEQGGKANDAQASEEQPWTIPS